MNTMRSLTESKVPVRRITGLGIALLTASSVFLWSCTGTKDKDPGAETGDVTPVGGAVTPAEGAPGTPATIPTGPKPTPKPVSLEGMTMKPYIVQKGDSLWKISQEQGSSVQAITQANNLSGVDIFPGQELKIPVSGGGALTTPTTPSTPTTPTVPSTPPSIPSTPTTPTVPSVPVTPPPTPPVTPPSVPDVPAVPSLPDVPSPPSTTPSVPSTPGGSDLPIPEVPDLPPPPEPSL